MLVAFPESLADGKDFIEKTFSLLRSGQNELAPTTVGQLELDGQMPIILLDSADENYQTPENTVSCNVCCALINRHQEHDREKNPTNQAKKPCPLCLRTRLFKWSGGESNPRPLHCERSALPTELPPHFTVIHYRSLQCSRNTFDCKSHFSDSFSGLVSKVS